MGCTPLNPAGFCFSGTWEGNTDPITLEGRPWEPPPAGWQPSHPLPRGVLEGFPSGRAFWCGCPAPVFKLVALKTEKKIKTPKQNKRRCPLIFPSQLCLQHGWGMNGHIPSPHGFSALSHRPPPPQSFPLLGLKSHRVSTAALPAPHSSEPSVSFSSCPRLRLPPSWKPLPAAHPCSRPEFPAPALAAIYRKPHLLNWSFPVDLINANPDTC